MNPTLYSESKVPPKPVLWILGYPSLDWIAGFEEIYGVLHTSHFEGRSHACPATDDDSSQLFHGSYPLLPINIANYFAYMYVYSFLYSE